MAASQTSGPSGPHNPTIQDIEAVHVDVSADPALDAVVLEVRDDSGNGFRTYFGAVQAMGIAWRFATAVDSLRQLPGTTP